MKMLTNVLTCIVLMTGFFGWSQSIQPQLKTSLIETGYIPQGFDSNDNVQMVIEGYYNDTCSKPAFTQAQVVPGARTILVKPFEFYYQGPCLDVLVQHNEVVNLGIVQPGIYNIQQFGGKNLGQLRINAATKSSADDFLYAPISQAYAKNMGGKVAVTISGNFSNSCMRLVKVAASAQANVITVLPLAEMMNRRENCMQGNYPFEQTVVVDNVQNGRYLLHVRSLNGNAVNNLFDVR